MKNLPYRLTVLLFLLIIFPLPSFAEYKSYNDCIEKETEKNIDLTLKKLKKITILCEDYSIEAKKRRLEAEKEKFRQEAEKEKARW